MNDEEAHHLLRSLKDERELVLIPRLKRLEEALKEIHSLTSAPTSPGKLARLVCIHLIAEEALAL